MRAADRAPKPARGEVLSLNVLAAHQAETAQSLSASGVLVRHFLDRFFGSEFASAAGDAKTHLLLALCVIGLPPFVLSLYLYPVYHLPLHEVRSFWQQAGDRYFFVLYTTVAMGVVAIFEWDLLFPDLLDVFVLSSLPVTSTRLLLARVTAIVLLVGAAILASSFLPPVVLPAATDPAHLFRFLAAHCAAVACSGIFSATLILALEAILLALLGDRWFLRISLWIQASAVVLLLSCLFLYPVVYAALPQLILSRRPAVLWFPPFWFLGLYQRILGGAAASPVFAALARTGLLATCATTVLAVVFYPLAWWRRTAALITGAARRERARRVSVPIHRTVHASLARRPAARAVWHFIGQNLLRVPRYRMVLVLYGGAGVALILAAALRIIVRQGGIVFTISPQGVRAIVPIAAFWTVSGLRSTFLAPADQRGRWIFRAVQGKPAWPHMQAARRWVLVSTCLLTLALAAAASCAASPHSWPFALVQAFIAVSLSLLLTDSFFLTMTTIPFTGSQSGSATNLALLMIPYLGFFPAIVLFSMAAEPWLEANPGHLALAATGVVAAHLCLLRTHKTRIRQRLQQIEVDEDEEEFPLRLGLRY